MFPVHLGVHLPLNYEVLNWLRMDWRHFLWYCYL